jgi:hypothetical protein
MVSAVAGSVTLARRRSATLVGDPRGGRVAFSEMTMAVTPGVRSAWARRWPAGLAWALWVLTMLCVVVIAWLDHRLRQAGRPDLAQLGAGAVPPVLAAVSASTVGAVLASRRSHHSVGWLLLTWACR